MFSLELYYFLFYFFLVSSETHPLIHASRRKLALPEAENEEEVKDVKDLPLTSIFEQKPNSSNFSKLVRTDRPHLRFHVTSTDGFEFSSHSLEGLRTCHGRHIEPV